MRGTDQDKIKYERDFNVESGQLYFQFTTCYNRIRGIWWTIHKENAPAKSIMSDNLKKDQSWLGTKDSHRFSPGRTGKNTSAFIIDMDKLPVGDELQYAIETQEREQSGQTNAFHPATLDDDPGSEKKKSDKGKGEVPF